MEDLNDKITGNDLTAAEWNQVPSEIQNVIESLGIALSNADLNQLGKAIAGYVANGSFYTDGGAADAYSLTVIGTKKAPPAYTNGMRVSYRPANDNTGASTVNVAGLGNKNIKTSAGADPAAGVIKATSLTELSFDLANDWFEIVEFGGGGQLLGTKAVKGIFFNAQNIDEDLTILGTTNAMSAGPITIDTGFTVTVETGARWVIN